MQRSRLTTTSIHLAAARYDAAQLGQKFSRTSFVFCIICNFIIVSEKLMIDETNFFCQVAIPTKILVEISMLCPEK